MKRSLVSIALIGGLLVGCGPSPEEQAQEIVACVLQVIEAERDAEECASIMVQASDEVSDLALTMLMEELALRIEDVLLDQLDFFKLPDRRP